MIMITEANMLVCHSDCLITVRRLSTSDDRVYVDSSLVFWMVCITEVTVGAQLMNFAWLDVWNSQCVYKETSARSQISFQPSDTTM